MGNFHGQFLWHEYQADDPATAVAFYRALMGWGEQAWNDDGSPYTLLTVDGHAIGGITALADEAREAGSGPQWLGYVGVTDLEATLRQSENLGGQVLTPPRLIEGCGRVAVVQDPQGAIFALITPTEESNQWEPGNSPIWWNELLATDEEAAWQFCRQLFGWDATGCMDMGEFGKYRMYGTAGTPFGGIARQPGETPASSFWLYYFSVDDMQTALDMIHRHGGAVTGGPMELPNGDRVARCRDPQGGSFALHALRRRGS